MKSIKVLKVYTLASTASVSTVETNVKALQFVSLVGNSDIITYFVEKEIVKAPLVMMTEGKSMQKQAVIVECQK